MLVNEATAVAHTGNAPSTAPQPRLVRAAHEFEALMLKELLRPMATSGALAGDNSDAESGSGTLNQFACESLAGALSAGGGIGIANRILQSFPGSGSNPKSVLGTDDLPFRPATNLHK